MTSSEEVVEKRAALNKAWSVYKYQQHRAEVAMIDQAAMARDRALEVSFQSTFPRLFVIPTVKLSQTDRTISKE